MMTTKPVAARNSMRTTIYVAWVIVSLTIFLGGLSPLFIEGESTLKLITFYGILIGGVPLLLIRTHFFDNLVTSTRGHRHPLDIGHKLVIRLLVVVMVVAFSIMIWRAATVGLPGWKTAFLLAYGLFLFYVAGWLLRAPRFMLRKSS